MAEPACLACREKWRTAGPMSKMLARRRREVNRRSVSMLSPVMKKAERIEKSSVRAIWARMKRRVTRRNKGAGMERLVAPDESMVARKKERKLFLKRRGSAAAWTRR
jgi:hypothetical protein